MSEFTQHRDERVYGLKILFDAILTGKNVKDLYDKFKELIANCVPSDVIFLVDEMAKRDVTVDELKRGINKILNLLYKTILGYPHPILQHGSYLWVLEENNRIMIQKLNELKPIIKKINQEDLGESTMTESLKILDDLNHFTNHYLIKENILFPLIEKHLRQSGCLSVMWSFHDDIRSNLKKLTVMLRNGRFDLKLFNRLAGDLFFNMHAIQFREDRILFPFIAETIPGNELENLFPESFGIGFPFYIPEWHENEEAKKYEDNDLVDLGTGSLTVNQIRLLFNHLPVDITYVDVYDKVRYFSTPKKRTFTRTKSIIGRDVHNCHPKESVHVVEKIVMSFKSGEKDLASFWINMHGQKLLIQYFAVRDENGAYQGVVEVTQEISDIQELRGEQRLLDWDD